MDGGEKPDVKRPESEEDEAIAHSLAAALREDDVENFLQLYDEIPKGISLERVSNINARIYMYIRSFPCGSDEFISRVSGPVL